MKNIKILLLIALSLLALCCFAACGDPDMPEVTEEFCTVSFESNGGSTVQSMRVKLGGYISAPDEPEKEGYVFNGWSYEGKEWLFSTQTVKCDMTLSARWMSAESLFEYEVADGEVIIKGYRGGLSRTSINIPSVIGGLPVTAIADEAFSNVDSTLIKRVILGENIVSVGNSAFYGSSELTVVIKGKLQHLGESAFYGCSKLESIELGEGLETVPYQAFYGCTSLKSVLLPESAKCIDENAFEDCTALMSLVMHSSLERVNHGAFLGCSSLVNVYYYGTADSWDSLDITSGNEALEAVKLYIYSETEPTDSENEYWYFDKNGKVRVW